MERETLLGGYCNFFKKLFIRKRSNQIISERFNQTLVTQGDAMEQSSQKECLYCAELIKAKALVCPHCNRIVDYINLKKLHKRDQLLEVRPKLTVGDGVVIGFGLILCPFIVLLGILALLNALGQLG